MKIHLFTFIFILLAIFPSGVWAQCSIEQLVAPSLTIWPGGQSFIPCQSGQVNEVQFKLGFSTATKAHFRLLDDACNVLWSTPNIDIASYSVVDIDLTSTGSGTTKNVTAGNTFHIQLLPSGGYIEFYYSDANLYIDGGLESALCIAFPPDLWFRIGIDQYLAVLPVELTSFTAQSAPDGPSAALAWHTASEQNTSHFTIQHSTDGLAFKDIGEVPAKGTTAEPQAYRFIHRQPAYGDNYYRLHIVDFDGSFEYSKVVHIGMGSEEARLLISPNPASGAFSVRWPRPTKQAGELILRHFTGQTVFRTAVSAGQQQAEIRTPGLEAGLYLLEWHDASGRVACERVVVGRS